MQDDMERMSRYMDRLFNHAFNYNGASSDTPAVTNAPAQQSSAPSSDGTVATTEQSAGPRPFFGGLQLWDRTMAPPVVEVSETPDAYVVHAETPGMTKDNVRVEVHDKSILISGESKSETKKEEGGRTLYTERSYGSFQRVIPFGVSVDKAAASAKVDNGVLEVRVPKKPGASDSVKVPIA